MVGNLNLDRSYLITTVHTIYESCKQLHNVCFKKKLGQSTVVYYYCDLSHFFETDVTYVLSIMEKKICC